MRQQNQFQVLGGDHQSTEPTRQRPQLQLAGTPESVAKYLLPVGRRGARKCFWQARRSVPGAETPRKRRLPQDPGAVVLSPVFRCAPNLPCSRETRGNVKSSVATDALRTDFVCTARRAALRFAQIPVSP